MVRRCRSRMRPDQPIPPFDPTPVTVTKPAVQLGPVPAPAGGGFLEDASAGGSAESPARKACSARRPWRGGHSRAACPRRLSQTNFVKTAENDTSFCLACSCVQIVR
jgi:hypothetical protein